MLLITVSSKDIAYSFQYRLKLLRKLWLFQKCKENLFSKVVVDLCFHIYCLLVIVVDIVKDQPKKLFHGYEFSIEEGGEVRLTSLNIRKRRSSSLRRYVELMVVADESMFEFYDRKEIELRRYVLSVMAIVRTTFLDHCYDHCYDYVKQIKKRDFIW